MTIKICPRCQQRYVVGFGVTDFVHECNSGNLALDQEDVIVVGNWEDFSGSGTIGPQAVMRQGIANDLQGTRAGIEGEKKEDVTARGNPADVMRQRQHYQYINLKGDGLQ